MWPHFNPNPLMKHSTVLHTICDSLHQSTGALMVLPNLPFSFIFSHCRLITLDSWRMTPSDRDTLLMTNTGSSLEDLFSSTLAMRETSPGSATILWIFHLLFRLHALKVPAKDFIIFFVGLYVGNCGGVRCHAGFCRTSLLWRVPTIWSRLLQCKWWCIKCSYSSGWII